MGKVFQTETAKDFLFGTDVVKNLPATGETLVDASAWVLGEKMLVGVVSGQYTDDGAVVSIELPVGVDAVEQVLYGDSSWAVEDGKLTKSGLKGLEVSVLVLTLST